MEIKVLQWNREIIHPQTPASGGKKKKPGLPACASTGSCFDKLCMTLCFERFKLDGIADLLAFGNVDGVGGVDVESVTFDGEVVGSG